MEPEAQEPEKSEEYQRFEELAKHLFAVPKTEQGEQRMDADQEASLKLVDEVMADPTGDCVITVESDDRELIYDLWALQSEGVIVTERLQQSVNLEPTLVWIAVTSGVLSITVNTINIVERVLKTIQSRQSQASGKKVKVKAQISTRDNIDEIKKLVAKYEKDVEAVINIPSDEG